MANEKELKSAKAAYDTLCATLDKMEWRYNKDDNDMVIRLGVNGDDLPMQFLIAFDADRQLIRLLSFLPFKMAEDKRVEGSLATNYINYLLADGSFDYNLSDGAILFRMNSSFRESLIGEEVFRYMIQCSCYTVDKYNDQLLMLSKGNISISEFISNC